MRARCKEITDSSFSNMLAPHYGLSSALSGIACRGGLASTHDCMLPSEVLARSTGL